MHPQASLSRAPLAGSLSHRLAGPALALGAVTAATLALRLRDPHVAGSWGFCPSRVLFGINCPGCGGLRAVNDLAHGDLMAAASSNLLFITLIPVIVLGYGLWARDAWSGVPHRPLLARSPVFGWTLLALALAFTVVRNLPVGAWLAP